MTAPPPSDSVQSVIQEPDQLVHDLELERLTAAELRRYSRPLLVPEWAQAGAQERLKAGSVLVVGAGGLGCPALSYLTGAGVGHIGISDSDTVGLSNLHRQTLYTALDIGQPKARVAASRLQALNPEVRLEVLPALEEKGAAGLLAEYDLLLDCTDNFVTRYLINDACASAGRRWVWGAAGGSEGMVSVFGPQFTLRDLFPDPGAAESCDEIGVLGPLLGVIGAVMAGEALKVLGGVGETLEGQLLTYDFMNARMRRIGLRPARQTPLASKSIP